ncbi:TonB-dependent receptor [Rhodohalobacter sulfatireducens]|uniref:Plug domain-containing protein n=1 Tax=Rhodohalobacter sulfatireducens TaxID=2911366 RepID=A0ABS9KC43_9BACT|nr:TonB-dependent receptor plug domain-containing protein [Rhodohalobacter sulfatireducens]MCG2588416.1 Plug domain-containing protein [Rhodohalobacter sulfatireducens]MDR9364220.1 TonB-dependent receptor plug domain-containing protein [Balneolaceae bacterium]MDR9407588.1 TonB-dependent receptor plug domain-containing protein [Balneolaceae bacterium]
MKYIITSLLFAGMLFITGCASTGSSSSGNSPQAGTEIMVDNPNLGLDIYLRRLSGVRVQGSGRAATISIRGSSSTFLESDTRPLFVIDGVRAGRSFSNIYTMLNMQNVSAVRVLKLSRANLLYGYEGRNGVIEIMTRS